MWQQCYYFGNKPLRGRKNVMWQENYYAVEKSLHCSKTDSWQKNCHVVAKLLGRRLRHYVNDYATTKPLSGKIIYMMVKRLRGFKLKNDFKLI